MTDREARDLKRMLEKYCKDYEEDPEKITAAEIINDIKESVEE